MKKIVSIFVLAICVMLILPASGVCDNFYGSTDKVETSLVNQIEDLIASNDLPQMESTLAELSLKAQTCAQMENPTDSQAEYCQQVSDAVNLLEQALSQD